MFLATAALYPCALAVMCLGAGLLLERAGGARLPASLLACLGLAALIALSQLSTYIAPLAPATPYLMLALSLAGFALARRRALELAARWRRGAWAALACVLAYALALAPVLAAGRASFSSYMALADSAVHMIGADYLLRHGQRYAHLDLRNSYGQFIHDYYGTSYPSGADTLFGGSAFLLGLPLIWAFQPFNAFVLACAAGPAWLLARASGLRGAWAAAASLAATLPALVYAYELLASVKELTSLTMILTLGALLACHRRWLGARARGPIPFALVLAAGVSALGPAFGAWALAPLLVLGAVAAVDRARIGAVAGRARIGAAPATGAGAPSLQRRQAARARRSRRRLAAGVALGALALLTSAWPTWAQLPSALRVAQAIATTGNSGNLHAPLRAIQALGVWLNGSYKLAPAGAALSATHALAALALAAALLGLVQLLRRRAYALCAWFALTLLASLIVSRTATTWADAKTLVLSSPAVVLLAWASVAALRSLPAGRLATAAAAALALALGGGVLCSDALQYHSSNLAPTARYEELASIGRRFSGRGPTLFTDFDEYSMYQLRDLDVGGPDFVYPPKALARSAGGYGRPVDLDEVSPGALAAYPLIVTRRDPAASRPPAAYALLWQGSYYQVWGRRPGAASPSAHVALSGGVARQCARIGALATRGRASAGARLVASRAPLLVRVPLLRASRPRRWGRERRGIVMGSPGTLRASFTVPHGGRWQVWVQGQIMPAVALSLDGRALASIAGQLDGNSLVPDTVPPLAARLSAGRHTIAVTRTGFSLAPGAGGAAVLDAIFLTPAAPEPSGPLRTVAAANWRALCGVRYRWVELIAPSARERRL
ncbi:MAG TPA: hypothetical protein VL979_04380 [Solirubrobacteraceae bacterium]|nr:hypothetical protein [Solirubrobacteraceae bacterium]